MTRREGVKMVRRLLANPQVVRGVDNEGAYIGPQLAKSMGPKWDSFQVNYLETVKTANGNTYNVRRVTR